MRPATGGDWERPPPNRLHAAEAPHAVREGCPGRAARAEVSGGTSHGPRVRPAGRGTRG